MPLSRWPTRVLMWLFISPSSAVHLWTAPAALPTIIPASCRVALSSNITCSPRLIGANEVEHQANLGTTFLAEYCNAACQQSLLSFQARVHSTCGDTLYAFSNITNQTGNSVADPLVWAYNVSCDIDKQTSSFCLSEILGGTAGPCGDCTLRYAANILGSVYGAAIIDPPGFSSILSSCGVDPSKYPYSTISPTTTSTITAPATATPTCTGSTYVVAVGDTCSSIASANSLALDRFLSENSIDYNCNSLQAGQLVCLGAECALHSVAVNETCADILSGMNFTLTELISWNPTIHKSCDNIGSMTGRTICISPPGTTEYLTPGAPQGELGGQPSNTTTTSFISTGVYLTGPTVGTTPTNFNTSYLGSTFAPAVTSIFDFNQTVVDQYTNGTQFCPVKDEDYNNGFDWEQLSETCRNLIDPYCNPRPNATVLTSRRFPASCSPAFFYTVSATANPTAKNEENRAIASVKDSPSLGTSAPTSHLAQQTG